MSQFDDDFWSEDNESTGEVSLGGGNFETIPDGTKCKAHIEEIEWASYDPTDENVPYIKNRWNIELPSEYENRKIFQNINLYGEDPTKKGYDSSKQETKMKNARAMYWAIDKNCGGKLAALKRKPKTEELQRYLIGKPMLITLGVWEINDKSGNWIRKIEPLTSNGNVPQQAAKPTAKRNEPIADDMDDDIPF